VTAAIVAGSRWTTALWLGGGDAEVALSEVSPLMAVVVRATSVGATRLVNTAAVIALSRFVRLAGMAPLRENIEQSWVESSLCAGRHMILSFAAVDSGQVRLTDSGKRMMSSRQDG
jgi:hypothetical protein